MDRIYIVKMYEFLTDPDRIVCDASNKLNVGRQISMSDIG